MNDLREFRGCGLTQFNVYVTVRAKNQANAEKIVERFFNDTQGKLDFTLTIQGKKVEVTFDECFEVIDVMEQKTGG